jgi:hypothetical protein
MPARRSLLRDLVQDTVVFPETHNVGKRSLFHDLVPGNARASRTGAAYNLL